MKEDEFGRIRSLREVLSYAERGRGIAGAVVLTFGGSREAEEREASRRVLLGHPLEAALRGSLSSRRGAWALLWYMVSESRVNLAEASKRAVKLSASYERWLRLRRMRQMEMRVMEMRGYIICAILGAVVSLLATLAPIISSFQVSLTPAAQPETYFGYLALGFALVSSTLLGFYLSPRRAYLNPAMTVGVYLAVMALAAPLASFTLPSVGG